VPEDIALSCERLGAIQSETACAGRAETVMSSWYLPGAKLLGVLAVRQQLHRGCMGSIVQRAWSSCESRPNDLGLLSLEFIGSASQLELIEKVPHDTLVAEHVQ